MTEKKRKAIPQNDVFWIHDPKDLEKIKGASESDTAEMLQAMHFGEPDLTDRTIGHSELEHVCAMLKIKHKLYGGYELRVVCAPGKSGLCFVKDSEGNSDDREENTDDPTYGLDGA